MSSEFGEDRNLRTDTPDSDEAATDENAPATSGRGRSVYMEHETGIAGQQSWPSACRAGLGREPATLTLAKRIKDEGNQ
jgi:hypothetical protein